MKKFIALTPIVSAFLLLYSHIAHAGWNVPEMDSAGAAVALGLTIAIVVLVKEYRKK
jgi:hypothetical protein